MSNSSLTVFQIPVEGPSAPEVLDRISHTTKPLWIVTLNPEMLVAAYRQPDYKTTLQQADLRTVDGFGLWSLLRFRGGSIHRVTGVALSEELLVLAQERGWRVGCFGGRMGTGAALKNYFHTRYPRLSFLIEEAGQVDQAGNQDEPSDEALHRLTLFSPEIVLVALGGGGTKQEEWIRRHISHLPNTRAILGVGGTFDYWTGAIRRAPRCMQMLGLEWLWRLSMEPARFKRIWTAVIVFPYLVIKERMQKKVL